MYDVGGASHPEISVHASALATRSTPDSPRERVSIAELYERHFRLIWWTVRGAGVADDAIEDVVHDAFVALFHRLPQFDGALPLERWLIGVARNAAFTHRRGGARRRLRAARLTDDDADPPALDEQLDRSRAWQQLQGFLAQLPEDQRDVFTLVELQGESVPAVASALDVKLNTVYARLRLARAKLDRWIADRRDHGDAQGWLHAAAMHAEAKPQQRLRTKLAVVTSLGQSTLAPPPWLLGKLWFAVPAAAIAAAITIAVTMPPAEPQPASSTGAATARAVAAEPNPIRAATIGSGAAIEAARATAPPSAPTPPPPRSRASGPRAPSLAAAAPQQPVDDGAPLADARWLAQASDALAARDAAGALDWLDRHQRAFPGSALAPERAVLRVDALCQSGRHDEARSVAATWRQRKDLPRVVARLEARLSSGC